MLKNNFITRIRHVLEKVRTQLDKLDVWPRIFHHSACHCVATNILIVNSKRLLGMLFTWSSWKQSILWDECGFCMKNRNLCKWLHSSDVEHWFKFFFYNLKFHHLWTWRGLVCYFNSPNHIFRLFLFVSHYQAYQIFCWKVFRFCFYEILK